MSPTAARPSTRRRLLAALALVLACVLGSGCNTPSVPLPPPSPDDFDISIMSQSSLVLSGKPQPTRPRARYEVYNETLGRGAIIRAQADGSFMSPAIEGRPADRLEISYQLGPEAADYASGILCIIVPASSATLSEADRCP